MTSKKWLAAQTADWKVKVHLMVNIKREEALNIIGMDGILLVLCSYIDNMAYVVAEAAVIPLASRCVHSKICRQAAAVLLLAGTMACQREEGQGDVEGRGFVMLRPHCSYTLNPTIPFDLRCSETLSVTSDVICHTLICSVWMV